MSWQQAKVGAAPLSFGIKVAEQQWRSGSPGGTAEQLVTQSGFLILSYNHCAWIFILIKGNIIPRLSSLGLRDKNALYMYMRLSKNKFNKQKKQEKKEVVPVGGRHPGPACPLPRSTGEHVVVGRERQRSGVVQAKQRAAEPETR